MDIATIDLVQSAVEAARSVLPQILIGAAGSAAWDGQKKIWAWIKDKLSGSDHSKIIEQVEQHPDKDNKWGLLSASLVDILEEDPNLVSELSTLLGSTRIEGKQIASDIGSNSNVVQIMGNNNTSQINK